MENEYGPQEDREKVAFSSNLGKWCSTCYQHGSDHSRIRKGHKQNPHCLCILCGRLLHASGPCCAFFGVVVPKRYKAVKEMIYDNPIGNRYMNDVEFKNRVSLYCSLGVNLLYVGTNVVSCFSISFGLVWYSRRILYDFSGHALSAGVV